MKILFVCLGNICRSPTAEEVFRVLSKKEGLSCEIDSAGTSFHHEGQLSDERMRSHALKKGYKLKSRSRGFIQEDFDEFDYIIAMDESNKDDILSLSRSDCDKKKVHKMTAFCENFQDDCVPDPYYGGSDGFNYVVELLEDACRGLITFLKGKEK